MVSIIVVSYNRAALLKECLSSILSQNFEGEFEVIIVSNGSCDGIEELLNTAREPRIKFITNKSRLDLASCKSLGIRASSGEIIAFTDDDCTVAKDWLKAIEGSSLNYDIIGGPVVPRPGTKFPRWWGDALHWLIGVNLRPDRKSLPLGSNIAFKRNVLLKTGEDKTRVAGPDPLCPPYTEDNRRLKRALACGFSMTVNKNMIVYHCVPRRRLTVSYLIKRGYSEGAGWAGYERNLGNLLFSCASLPCNLTRLIIFLDINRFFWAISNFSYIFHYLKKSVVD